MAEQSNVTAEQRPDPNEKLVKVFDSEQESEALVVKGLLDSAGIESDLKSGSFVQDAFPGLGRNGHSGAGRRCGEGAEFDRGIAAVGCGGRRGRGRDEELVSRRG